jgi:hypothetical protein
MLDHVRRIVRWVACVIVVAAIVFGAKSARACGRGGYGLEGLAYVAAAGAIVVGGVVIADTTLTVYDSVHAQTSNPPSIGWATTERWMSTTQVVIGGLVGLPMLATGKDALVVFPTVLALTTWPAALMAHGFYAHEADPYGDGWQTPVAVVGTIDGLLGVYDVAMAATGRHVDDVYAVAEIVGTAPQVAFGLAYAGETGGHDGRTALLFTALPLALVAHGIVELAIPERHDDEPPPNAVPPTTVMKAIVPTFLVQGARGPAPGFAILAAF